jgi:hypothetical protein
MSSTKFEERLAERRAQREAAELAQKAELAAHDEDLLPQIEYERSEEDNELDAALEGIDIIDAYRRWCGKMEPKVRGDQREGIMISCPVPGHIDSNPSAWINLDKQTWNCATCGGGDKFDIAAYRLGFNVPGYKEGAEFHKLREAMARDFGFTVSRTLGGATIVVPPVENEEYEPPTEAEIVNLNDEDDDFNPESFLAPGLDWHPVCPPETFLYEYMKATTIDDIAEEFHFFNGLVALGFALGKDVRLFDAQPVYGNLFICVLGSSGSGKSRSKRYLDTLLSKALPYDKHIIPCKGVKRINSPGSGEVLIQSFMEPVPDPANSRIISYYAPVKGIVSYPELSSLTGRSARVGSTIKDTLQQFYDMEDRIETSAITTGGKIAQDPFASAITTSQPSRLRDLLSDKDVVSGFINRWLFVTGTEKPPVAIGGEIIDVGPAVKPLEAIHGWAGSFKATEMMQWSNEAWVKFTEFFNEMIVPDIRRSGTALMSRLNVTMKKLVMLFAANRMEKIVSEQSVLDAMYCYPYIKATYALIGNEISHTLASEISDAINGVCQRYEKKHKKSPTISEIARLLARRKYDKGLLLKVIKYKIELGEIEEIRPKAGTRGNSQVRYRYVG